MVGGNYGRITSGITGLSIFKGTAYGPAEYLTKRQKRYRRMNQEEFDRYHKKVNQSKGFDVDGCTGCMSGRIIAISPTNFEWKISNIAARFAAFEHGGERLEVLSLDKSNIQPVQGTMYYLTFTAIDHGTVDKEIKTYRAKVCYGAPSNHFRLLYFKEFKPPKKAVTACKAQGSKSGTKISKAKKAQGSMSGSKISKAKKGTVLQAGGVLPGFTALLRSVKSQNPSMTQAMARDVASKKWKSLSNAEKRSFIYEASQK